MREGLEIGGRVVPLLAGSVHYWRLDPKDWRPCLLATQSLGLPIIDTYVPWNVHEIAPGVLELGANDPKRDLAAFLKIVHDLGLYAIVRPGPHINAELTHFGIPERVVWDPACQARSPKGNPVVLPMLPQAFPVPSYASEVFLDETARYFRALGATLGPLLYPDGPVVMLQVDNEGAMYFRDSAYDQDYHPDAIALYRAFLRDKYKTLEALGAAYGFDPSAEGSPRFGDIEPPVRFDAKTPAELVRHVDWAELHEHMLARAMHRFAGALTDAGLDGLPRSHNFPPGQEATPLNAARVGGAVDLIGYDYYNQASPTTRVTIMRRTSELAVRCDALGVPAFGCEMGAGFPPFFPPLDERDSVFTVLTALAYGLRGFNLYMAVERDRWIGAPIDPHGRERPFSLFWRKLTHALAKLDFERLRRRAPVRILIPRNERRLARVTHAFGPVSGAFFSVAGAGARESCLEDDLGLGYHERLCAAASSGTLVTVGPRSPELGGARRALSEPLDLARLRSPHDDLPVLCKADPGDVERLVARAIEAFDLPAYGIDPDGVFATLHEDERGAPKVLFLINPSESDCGARVVVGGGVSHATDVLKDQSYEVVDGALDIRVKPKTVRMLALS
ncbi:MAG: beta-galactosidase [Polyangiaceae bacterium]|nr:beta-galactosidase [Polyangiaceae bacterium]